MRPDMGKCVIEAPRRNSSAPSAKVRDYGRITQDDEGYDYEGFTRLPVSRKQEGYNKKLGSKDFTDKLGPLQNYLENSCGRLWDDVYSEIAYNLGRFTKKEGIRHIITAHLDVETNTYRGVDGNVWYCGDHGVYRVQDSYHRYRQFYVEPETGILRLAERARERYPRKPAVSDEPTIAIEPGREYRRIKNIWYYVEYSETIERSPMYLGGVLYRYSEQTVRLNVHKRQIGKKELKKLGLR